MQTVTTPAPLSLSPAAPASSVATRTGPRFVTALAWAMASLIITFLVNWHRDFGISKLDFSILFRHGQATSELVAAAAGASLAFPTLQVAIASVFRSKRNAFSRRRIYIGWAVAMILLQGFLAWTKA